jgi:hypothetical protein
MFDPPPVNILTFIGLWTLSGASRGRDGEVLADGVGTLLLYGGVLHVAELPVTTLGRLEAGHGLFQFCAGLLLSCARSHRETKSPCQCPFARRRSF